MDIINTIFWATGILAITIVFIIIVVKFRKALAQSNSRLDNIPSQVYNSNRGAIEYLLIGDGPTILVSHGITGGVDQGIGLSEDFLGKDYRLLFISRFGYLNSAMPDNPSPELQAEVYKELIDYLGIENVFILARAPLKRMSVLYRGHTARKYLFVTRR